jgi:hypothetical protein
MYERIDIVHFLQLLLIRVKGPGELNKACAFIVGSIPPGTNIPGNQYSYCTITLISPGLSEWNNMNTFVVFIDETGRVVAKPPRPVLKLLLTSSIL